MFSFTENEEGNGFIMNARLNDLPLLQEIDIKIMEFGDLSSLAVEYPDYNSLGNSILHLYSTVSSITSTEAFKITEKFSFPKNITSLNGLAGRAVIITKDTDLIGFGIMVNETKVYEDTDDPVHQINKGR